VSVNINSPLNTNSTASFVLSFILGFVLPVVDFNNRQPSEMKDNFAELDSNGIGNGIDFSEEL